MPIIILPANNIWLLQAFVRNPFFGAVSHPLLDSISPLVRQIMHAKYSFLLESKALFHCT